MEQNETADSTSGRTAPIQLASLLGKDCFRSRDEAFCRRIASIDHVKIYWNFGKPIQQKIFACVQVVDSIPGKVIDDTPDVSCGSVGRDKNTLHAWSAGHESSYKPMERGSTIVVAERTAAIGVCQL